MRAILVLLICLAPPAAAQDVIFEPGVTESCLDTGKPLMTCVGAAADHCMEVSPGGSSTVGMGFCLEQEWLYWDGRLNDAYAVATKLARQTDAEMKDLGATVPSQEEALRAMQRAWIPFRDRKCDYVRSFWGGGTGGGPASIACLMRETARQSEFLGLQGAIN